MLKFDRKTTDAFDKSSREDEFMPHFNTLFNIAVWLTMGSTQAESLVTATLLSAYRRRADQANTAPAKVRLLRLLVRTYFRDKQFEPLPNWISLQGGPTKPTAGEPSSRDPGHVIDATNLPVLLSMDAASVRASVARLRPLFRLIMVLHFSEGCSYRDIAIITDLQEDAVKVRLRCIRRLIPRQLLSEVTRSANSISPTTPTSRNSEGWLFPVVPNRHSRVEIEAWDNEGGAVGCPGER